MGEMGRKRWLDDLYGKLLRLHLHYIWPRRKPYGLIARARGKSLPGPPHGLEPAAQQLRPLWLMQLLRLVFSFDHLTSALFGPSTSLNAPSLADPRCRRFSAPDHTQTLLSLFPFQKPPGLLRACSLRGLKIRHTQTLLHSSPSETLPIY